jgi:hypothetical protein
MSGTHGFPVGREVVQVMTLPSAARSTHAD